jgi:hypothetical protein
MLTGTSDALRSAFHTIYFFSNIVASMLAILPAEQDLEKKFTH